MTKGYQNLVLLLSSLLLCFLLIEAFYRLIDPFPYIKTEDDVAPRQHGHLAVYDSLIGWRGTPKGESDFRTRNNLVHLIHNSQGFRDVEHSDSGDVRPKIVLLGDSFAWGFEVEFDQMMVNLFRDRRPEYEVFNLAYRGYGTDQALLTFREWHVPGKLAWVFLIFSENDVADNNSSFRYGKPKPRFQVVHDSLVLTGVPVPYDASWSDTTQVAPTERGWKAAFRRVLFTSHFVHDAYYRIRSLLGRQAVPPEAVEDAKLASDLSVTSLLLGELKREVESRDGKLVVVFIPSKAEIERLSDAPPYQRAITDLCTRQGIDSFDLAPSFESTWRRLYFRLGMHLNARGHRLAAEALDEYLRGRE